MIIEFTPKTQNAILITYNLQKINAYLVEFQRKRLIGVLIFIKKLQLLRIYNYILII